MLKNFANVEQKFEAMKPLCEIKLLDKIMQIQKNIKVVYKAISLNQTE